MVLKCKRCGEKVVKFPLKDENGKIIWINLFKMDLMSLFYFITIIALILSQYVDMINYKGIIEDPCGFCDNTSCCKCLVKESELQQIEDMFIVPTTLEEPEGDPDYE